MFLNRVKIENFRGFKRINVAFEPTTVLIGENNYGKTSLLDALHICLGDHGGRSPLPFAPADFRVVDSDTTDLEPIKVTVTLRERRKKQWKLPKGDKLRPVTKPGPRGLKQIVLRVVATPVGKARRARCEWFFTDRAGQPVGRKNDRTVLRELRRRHPFFHVRNGALQAESSSPAPKPGGDRDPGRRLERQVEAVYRALSTSRAPIPDEQLKRGVEAVDRLMERAAERFRLDSPRRLLDTVVQTPVPFAVGQRSAPPASGAGFQALGRLLLFGAVLEARGGKRIAADATPILALEEPEAHQHPQMLASLWAVLHEFPLQKIVTTNSSELLAAVPLRSLRRLMRRRGSIEVFRPGNRLDVDEVRRISYHIRVRRGGVLFARCWLLIEGETEFWLLPEFARLLGYELQTEGVRCVEFAQSGATPLIKLARDLGVEWHLVTDGDTAGRRYAETARTFLGRDRERDRITQLREPDVEQCLWNHGYAEVYCRAVGIKSAGGRQHRRDWPATVIERAQRRRSKPGLALEVLEAAAAEGSPGVPPVLEQTIETVVRLARTCTR